MKKLCIFLLLLLICELSTGQASIEPAPGMVKADPRLVVRTSYLLVPEDHNKPTGKKIKLPFLFVRRPDQDAHKNITLYMAGGPGYSATAGFDSIRYNAGFLRYGGFIAFDQRGTKRAQPYLACTEVDEAIKRSYRENKNRDSLVLNAVKGCREKFIQQGIDLSAYTTTQSAEDVNALRLALGIDSLILSGISYSGSLMLAVVKQHPEAVRMLLLDSPLPNFINYEEWGLANIDEALEQVFTNAVKDSSDQATYGNLKTRFRQYFTTIHEKKFTTRYQENGTKDSISIRYTKNELLDAIIGRLNAHEVKTVPGMINDIINGYHTPYIQEVLDGYFAGDKDVALGMRYSVYCSGQIAFANRKVMQQQEQLHPWLAGYAFNNVDHTICSCWNVKPEPLSAKTPVSSNIPVLISGGDVDRLCRPFFNRQLQQYLPNSQSLLFHDKGHGAGFAADGVIYIDAFMKEPYKKMTSSSPKHIVQ